MGKPIVINSFQGMNNVKESERSIAEGVCEPAILLNSYTTPQGRVLKRPGSTQFILLSDAHSLWGREQIAMLCVANDVLYRIDSGTATPLCDIVSHGTGLNYVGIENKVYMSCNGWAGIYDAALDTVSSWGIELPSKPEITLINGDIPPGTYSFCYTNIVNGQTGGNGAITRFSVENESFGVRLIHAPGNCLIWMTDVNGGEFFLVGNTSDIADITSVYHNIPMPAMDVIPAPHMTALCLFAGRIWGSVGKKLYYTDPGVYEWFKVANSFSFTENILAISAVDAGLFVSSKNSNWILAGTNPLDMTVKLAGNGIIQKTIVGADSHEPGEEMVNLKHKRRVLMWIGPNGLMQGNQQLSIESLTEEVLEIPFTSEGAGLSMTNKGINQTLFTLKVSKNLAMDLNDIFSAGQLY